MKESIIKEFSNGDTLVKVQQGGYKYYLKGQEIPIEIISPMSVILNKENK